MERKKYLSVASVLSTMAVVCLHTNSFWNFSYSKDWIVSNFIECLFYFAVPVFFMIGGATLFDYSSRYSTKDYFAKRIKKTVIPFVFWSLVAIPFSIKFLNAQYDYGIKNIISMTLQTQVVGYFWYFIPLFVTYLVIPVFSKMDRDLKESVFKYCIFLTFILNAILPFASKISNIGYNPGFSFTIGSGYISYCMIGYLIDNTEINMKHRLLIYFLGLLGFILHFGGTWYLSYKLGAIDVLFKDYLNFPTYLYSIAIFVFIKQFCLKVDINKRVGSIINYFSSETFNVYLLQYFFLTIIPIYCAILYDNVIYRFLAGIALFIIITILSKLLKKIPYIRCILP